MTVGPKFLPVLMIGLASSLSTALASTDGAVVAVAHASDENTLSPEDYNSLFRGTMSRWSNGERVTLVLPPSGSDVMTQLCADLSVDERLYRRHLRELALRGEIRRPIEAATTGQIIELVASTPGAVAPVSSLETFASTTLPASVRPLSLQTAP